MMHATLVRERVEELDAYPFSLPAVRALDRLKLTAGPRANRRPFDWTSP
jgi:predicted ATPase